MPISKGFDITCTKFLLKLEFVCLHRILLLRIPIKSSKFGAPGTGRFYTIFSLPMGNTVEKTIDSIRELLIYNNTKQCIFHKKR